MNEDVDDWADELPPSFPDSISDEFNDAAQGEQKDDWSTHGPTCTTECLERQLG